jgi:prepilin-type N-terminal cleavage/methylation domain-containing protein
MPKQKGFTLVELLMVIAIIGLLSTIAVVSFNNAKARARDAKRMGDLTALRKAIDIYIQDHNNQIPEMQSGNWVNFIGLLPLSGVPRDPINNTQHRYLYCFNLDINRYFVYATLERPLASGFISGPTDCNPPDRFRRGCDISDQAGQCLSSDGSLPYVPVGCDDTHFCLGDPLNN